MITNTAIVLAGGSASRMNSTVPKQYMDINGKPVLFYSLYEFEYCEFITDVVLVTRAEDIEYCRNEIVDKYGFTKVKKITAGGKERFLSVYNGLKYALGGTYVWIHDGARPCIDRGMLTRLMEAVTKHGAVAAAVPSKDTVKISDGNGFVKSTPDRSLVWNVQTPQVFVTEAIWDAYEKMLADGNYIGITDDAMVMERYGNIPVFLEMGGYTNIKITTPEDVETVKNYLNFF